MIACAQCKKGRIVEEGNNRYFCEACGYKILVENRIVFFHPEEKDSNVGIEACILDDTVKSEKKHFWMSARRYYLKAVFDEFVKREDNILEIGAGTGFVAKYLIDHGYKNITIGDIHKRGLELSADYGYQHKYQFNLMKNVFYEHFDIVYLFDVLEHIDDDDLAVKNINKMLKAGGKAIVTVPAHQWLWSKQDAIASHRRRYEVDTLQGLFIKNGFKILKSSAFFISLVPFMYIRTIINRDNGRIKPEEYQDRFEINFFLNNILKAILYLEIWLLKKYPLKYGGSCILVAEKTASLDR